MERKLKIQIWSDIMCPFCYIGKRRIETALKQFDHADDFEIEWNSFQLYANPILLKNEQMSEHLAKKYQQTMQWAHEKIDSITQNAKKTGLNLELQKVTMENSFNAHRLLFLAKKNQLSNELQELLFKANLSDGKNINDQSILTSIGLQSGLTIYDIEYVLHTNVYTEEVNQEIQMASNIGIKTVPFFVFDNKYAIAGAQHVATFISTLEKVWMEGKIKA